MMHNVVGSENAPLDSLEWSYFYVYVILLKVRPDWWLYAWYLINEISLQYSWPFIGFFVRLRFAWYDRTVFYYAWRVRFKLFNLFQLYWRFRFILVLLCTVGVDHNCVGSLLLDLFICHLTKRIEFTFYIDAAVIWIFGCCFW